MKGCLPGGVCLGVSAQRVSAGGRGFVWQTYPRMATATVGTHPYWNPFFSGHIIARVVYPKSPKLQNSQKLYFPVWLLNVLNHIKI